MQEELKQTPVYYCRKCRNELKTDDSKCPQCGKPMQTISLIKSMGKVLFAIGVMLSVTMALLILGVLSFLLFSQTVEKDPSPALVALCMFGFLLTFGVTCIIGGLLQSKHGKPSRMVKWIILSLAVLIFIIGRVVLTLID